MDFFFLILVNLLFAAVEVSKMLNTFSSIAHIFNISVTNFEMAYYNFKLYHCVFTCMEIFHYSLDINKTIFENVQRFIMKTKRFNERPNHARLHLDKAYATVSETESYWLNCFAR